MVSEHFYFEGHRVVCEKLFIVYNVNEVTTQSKTVWTVSSFNFSLFSQS